MVYAGNRYLNRSEMTVNATYLMDKFLQHGWSKNAIAGMLGNMESESTINPAIWQNLNPIPSNGYGLVQWTPSTNYTNWAIARGDDITDIDSQIDRIIYELNNGLQYDPTVNYPETFQQFTVSTKSPEYLASAFLFNYERAGVEVEQDRRNQARYWFTVLDGEGIGSKPFFPTTLGTPMTSPYGWRIHPIYGDLRFHDGTDFATSAPNTPIYATQTGVVIANDFHELMGWYIRIKHSGDHYYSGYQHLESQSTFQVGQTVTKGERIGTMGSSGDSTGVHLHFQIATHSNGFHTEEGTIDPLIYLDMTFDGGGTTPEIEKDLISLWLSDALNGWKY